MARIGHRRVWGGRVVGVVAAIAAGAWAGCPCHVLGAPVQNRVRDRYVPVALDRQQITGGVLAERMRVNLEERLLKVDEHTLLDGFVHRPGKQAWIGEHAGKFLHAAANTYLYTHDPRLKELMDRVAGTLMSAQMADGYLGTYAEEKRWTGWDVWAHKYDMLGLLAWYDVTGDERALRCCERIGDLLCRTFGEGPGQRDLSLAGEHVGMAATSVLEPMCYLYRHTGEKRYLDFCYYITRNIEQHSKVISSLTAGKRVDQTANGKAYEMLSNLLGLVELYRLTGEERFLVPAKNAWGDIVANHLYLTGTTSSHEYFHPPGELPGGDADDVGEGCVTVTWMQLNLSLLRLTGEAKYADQLERTIYNQLLAAQNPEDGDICYFTPMVGHKPYEHAINCCLSSEPRGIALIPEAVWGVEDNAIAVNMTVPGRGTFEVVGTDGRPVTVEVTSETDFPVGGGVRLTLKPSRAATVAVVVRRPSWCTRMTGWGEAAGSGREGYQRYVVELPAGGKTVAMRVEIPVEFGYSRASYPDSFALVRGPQVLAFEPVVNPGCPIPAAVTVDEAGGYRVDAKGGVFTFGGHYSKPDVANGRIVVAEGPVKLVPFSEAKDPVVWLPARGRLATGPLPVTFGGEESFSRAGRPRNQGSITDLQPDTMHVTYDRKKAAEDWYAVTLPKPAVVGRVVFRHGKCFHDGGWFDASGGKPRVEVKESPGGEWEMVGTLESYPETTGTDAKGIKDGEAFEVVLAKPVEAAAVRVVGRPACGDNPKQAFSTCSELAAYANDKRPAEVKR